LVSRIIPAQLHLPEALVEPEVMVVMEVLAEALPELLVATAEEPELEAMAEPPTVEESLV